MNTHATTCVLLTSFRFFRRAVLFLQAVSPTSVSKVMQWQQQLEARGLGVHPNAAGKPWEVVRPPLPPPPPPQQQQQQHPYLHGVGGGEQAEGAMAAGAHAAGMHEGLGRVEAAMAAAAPSAPPSMAQPIVESVNGGGRAPPPATPSWASARSNTHPTLPSAHTTTRTSTTTTEAVTAPSTTGGGLSMRRRHAGAVVPTRTPPTRSPRSGGSGGGGLSARYNGAIVQRRDAQMQAGVEKGWAVKACQVSRRISNFAVRIVSIGSSREYQENHGEN